MGSFDRPAWAVDSYTGWGRRRYTYESGFSVQEVRVTQYEKARRDYANYLSLFNASVS